MDVFDRVKTPEPAGVLEPTGTVRWTPSEIGVGPGRSDNPLQAVVRREGCLIVTASHGLSRVRTGLAAGGGSHERTRH
jgi:hypothetical protein